MVGQCGNQNFMKYNLDKNCFKSHKDFVKHNESVRKKNHKKHIENKSFGSLATIERFKDAENERRKVYRRASAKLISRMFNKLLVPFHGSFIQKANQSIQIVTPTGVVTMKNSNVRKFGLNKGEKVEDKFKTSEWKLVEENCTLSMSDLIKERHRISNYFLNKYNRIKALPKDSIKHNSVEKYLFKWEEKNQIVFNTITPKFDKLDAILKGYDKEIDKVEFSKGIENFSNPYQVKSKVISKGKAKIKKVLPNAKQFNSINPDGTIKKTKTLYQSKRRFL